MVGEPMVELIPKVPISDALCDEFFRGWRVGITPYC
jgi:hypothetical protein